MNTNGCPPHAKYISQKTFDALIKTIYMLLYTSEHSHPTFLTIYLNSEPDVKYLHFFPVPDYYLMISEST